jgi:hypothetical protein
MSYFTGETISRSSRRIAATVWILATIAPLLAISHDSLWIDEALTARFVTAPTVKVFEKQITTGTTSERQMPLYIVYVWIWQKLFGKSEISLRLASYPWFLIGQLAGAFIWKDYRKNLLFISVAASSSFIWFYLNEARPYIMQYGAACIALWFLCLLVRRDSIALWKYWTAVFGLIVLASANLLGVLWVGTFVLIAAFLIRKKKLHPPIPPLAFFGTAMLLLGGYYLWTLLGGARATFAQQTILNVLYVAYELCGFTGLGPGRLEFREQGPFGLQHYLVPVTAFAVVLFLIFFRVRKAGIDEESRSHIITGAIFALPPMIFLSIAGAFIDFRVLGRHVMPVAPFVFLLFSSGLFACLGQKTVSSRVLVFSFFLLSAASCLGVRFLPWHFKDDYRGAAVTASAMLKDHQVAWWCANEEGAQYYNLPLDAPAGADGRRFVYVRNPDAARIQTFPAPTVVVLSKKDLYDENGTIATMLKEEHFVRRKTLPAFSIWEKPPTTPAPN